MKPLPRTASSGVTLVELMIAVAIVSIAILGAVRGFGAIAVSIQQSKMNTLASNLAQEKMQILKQVSYYRLLVTTATMYDSSYSPAIPYDTGYYPPETVFEGGVNFQRYTHVEMASEVDGNLQMSGMVPDTGMKSITVTVTWTQGGNKKMAQLRSIKSNPNTVMSNATIKGVIRKSGTTTAIPNANVAVAENMGWQDNSDTDGNYSVSIYPGNYSLIVTAHGYFPQYFFASVAANQAITQNFDLVEMASGTVQGTAWICDHPVISQVVASTVTAEGFSQEYVELYNPTTSYIPMAAGLNTSLVTLSYQGESDAFPRQIALSYATMDASMAPNSYFLIANTTTVTACGVTRDADAVYQTFNAGYPDIIKCPDAGMVAISRTADGLRYDTLGWDRFGGGKTAPLYETNGIDQNAGLTEGEQYVRRSSTTGVSAVYGRAYDSDNNNLDFIDNVTVYAPPKNSAVIEPCISGTPAVGAVVSVSDGLSFPVRAVKKGTGSNPPYAEFTVPEIATGTWTTLITSGSYTLEITTVILTTNGEVVGVPNALTTPLWPADGYHVSQLTQEATIGYISGRVLNAAGAAISPQIKVMSNDSQSTFASTANGMYTLPLGEGTYAVTANPGNANPLYISQQLENIPVSLGQITSGVDFVLSQGGQVRGWVTRDGVNPLPGVSIIALDPNGAARGQDISKNDGKFLIINLDTGSYTVQTVLDSGETSTPLTLSAEVTGGSSIFIGTFTITGAFGKIAGSLNFQSKPISTGVLILATPSTITSPPAINSALGTGMNLYSTNSYENGTYSLDVRGSTMTTYNVYAYYPRLVGQTPVISTGTASGITVVPGQTTPNINFSW